jgi:hypothetical protein
MADEPQELRRINWSECFGFIQIFRAFRLAVHPSKIILALIGIVLTGAVGVVMDAIWTSAGCYTWPGEVVAYIQPISFNGWETSTINGDIASVNRLTHSDAIVDTKKYEDLEIKDAKTLIETLDKLPGDLIQHFRDTIDKIDRTNKKEDLLAICATYASQDYPDLPRAKDDVEQLQEDAKVLAGHAHHVALKAVTGIQPRGVFASFIRYERGVIEQAAYAAMSLNIVGGSIDVLGPRQVAGAALVDPSPKGPGLLPCVLLAGLGFKWLIWSNTLYAIIFLLLLLAIWSLLGGAICRIAALHAARDERISIKQALCFARRKFIGFAAAPIVPAALIVFVGIFLIIGGLVGSIPVVGEILTGVFFGLALLGGFIMALVVVGAVAGGSLMWPTIAVEGSDSFDAISRSFSYVYSRPWRAGLYFLIAAVYGTICFLFARLFVLITLKLTHLFVGIGMRIFTERPGAGEQGTKLDALWVSPTFERLFPHWSSIGVAGSTEVFGGFLIFVWVALIVAATYAFAISFYLSGSTIIYYLLRRKVDATDLEDVYLEETEEEEEAAEAAPGAPSGESASAPGPATQGEGGGDAS